jgi:c-di-AMP phosphodiesterase-like protein
MKKGLRITSSILIPLILNITFILFIVYKDSVCERKAFRSDIDSQNIYWYLSWIILQIIVVGFIFIKSNFRKQIIALPLLALLFIALLTSWTIDLKDKNNFQKFDKEMWMNPNHFFRINYVEDIISNKKLESKCYNEIIDMLGKPKFESKDKLEYEVGFGIMIIKLENNCFKQVDVECK